MKRRITTTAMLFMLFALACKKEETRRCYTCTSKISYSPSYGTSPTTTTTQLCNKTAGDIQDYESAGTSTTTSTSGNVTITARMTTHCN